MIYLLVFRGCINLREEHQRLLAAGAGQLRLGIRKAARRKPNLRVAKKADFLSAFAEMERSEGAAVQISALFTHRLTAKLSTVPVLPAFRRQRDAGAVEHRAAILVAHRLAEFYDGELQLV